jgi:RimJ/RimL family protein N-acetyltransferase
LEKFGFQQEGYKRKAVVCKATGKIHDEYCYGLLKSEYKNPMRRRK